MKIAEQSDAGKAAKAQFEEKADRLKTQIDTKQKLLEKQKAALEAKLPTYTPEQRAAKIKAYEKKVDELRKLLQQADKEMKPIQEELTQEDLRKDRKDGRRVWCGATALTSSLRSGNCFILAATLMPRT